MWLSRTRYECNNRRLLYNFPPACAPVTITVAANTAPHQLRPRHIRPTLLLEGCARLRCRYIRRPSLVSMGRRYPRVVIGLMATTWPGRPRLRRLL